MITTMIMIGGVLGYRLGKRIFANPEVEDTNHKLRQYIKEAKKSAKIAEGIQDSESSRMNSSNLSNALIKNMSVALN
jgi:hypothetical protein